MAQNKADYYLELFTKIKKRQTIDDFQCMKISTLQNNIDRCEKKLGEVIGWYIDQANVNVDNCVLEFIGPEIFVNQPMVNLNMSTANIRLVSDNKLVVDLHSYFENK